MQVMLVDDDTMGRLLLARLLRRSGFEIVAQAGNGAEALRMLQRVRPYLIITDCQMPRMDGLTLLRTLRGRGDRIPLIMLSGQGSPVVTSTVLGHPATAYLAKPLDFDRLLEAIDQFAAVPAAG